MNISADNCRKCKKCERICPVSGLDINNDSVSDDCIMCHHCAAICPENAIDKDDTIGITTQNNIQPFDFELLVQQRRSHRNFSSKPIPPAILSEFIKRLRFSPTASNMQSLEFTVVTNPEKLKEINDLTISTLTKAFNGINSFTRPLLKLLKGKETLETMEQSKRKFVKKASIDKNMVCYNAPALIVVHSKNNPVGMPCHDANIWTGMAMLYAELIDLCTCVNGFIASAAARNKQLQKSLNIPNNHSIQSCLLIGYPKTKFENKVKRKKPKISCID